MRTTVEFSLRRRKEKKKNTQPIHLCLWRLWCCHGNLTRPCCISFDMDQILAYGLIHLLCIPSPPGINLRLVYNIFSRYTHPISGMGGVQVHLVSYWFPITAWRGGQHFQGLGGQKKKRALDVSLLPNDYYKRDTSRYSFSRGCGRRNVEGRSPRFIAPKVPAEFLSLPFRALICLNTLALIQSASSTCAGFQQQYWFWEISS